MKRLGKIFSAVLLLAIALSAFGVFSVFAAGKEAQAPTVVYDMDSSGLGSWKNHKKLDNGKISPSATKVTGDDLYWLFETNVKEGENIGTGSGAYSTITLSPAPVLRSYTVSASGKEYDKDTDFMVIDFDVAADDELLGMTLNMRRYDSADKAGADSNGNPEISGLGYDNLHYLHAKKTAMYPVTELENKWVNFTVVYDVRGEDTASWKASVYIDGYYVGYFALSNTTLYRYGQIRLQFPGVATADYQSIKVRNFTVKSYPVGWEGDLSGHLKLAQYGSTLYDIEELGYCLEGVNPKRSGLLASIQRGDEKINVYKFSDLDANFKDGDVVTLYRNVTTPILVNADNVTFKDNGYLYNRVDTSSITDWENTKYVVLNAASREILSSGDAAKFDTITSFAHGDVIVMLDDLTRTLSAKDGYSVGSKSVIFDINGHHLTLAGTNLMFNTDSGTGGFLRFANGELTYKNTVAMTLIGVNHAVVYENLTKFTIDAKTNIDQRNGLVFVKNSTVNIVNCGTEDAPAYAPLTALKSNENVRSSLFVIDSTITSGKKITTATNLFSSSNVTGGINTSIKIDGSLINSGNDAMFAFTSYANRKNIVAGEDGTLISTNKNDFNVDFDITDSTLTTSGVILDATLNTLTHAVSGLGTYKANGLDIDINIDIDNSEIKCANLTAQKNAAYKVTDVDFAFDVNIEADKTSKLQASNGIAYIERDNESINTNVTLADGVKLGSYNIDAASTKKAANVTLSPVGSVIAGSSLLEGYSAVVTSIYRECTYQVNNFDNTETLVSGTFLWNSTRDVGDKVDMSRIYALPASTTEYVYSDWKVDDTGKTFTSNLTPNFKMAANLTAFTDFYLNVYLPATVDISKLKVNINGVEITEFEIINIDGTDYYASDAAVIKGITPEGVADAYPVSITLDGALGETMTVNTTISIEKYLKSARKTYRDAYAAAVENEDEAAAAKAENSLNFVQTIINYVVTATNYGEGSRAPDALKQLATSVKAPQYRNAKWNGPAGMSAALNLGDSVRWVFTTENKDATYTISYAGVTRTFSPDENGEIVIGILAVDLLGDITITDNTTGESGTINLAGYYKSVTDVEAKAVINSLYHYSVAASSYAQAQDAE